MIVMTLFDKPRGPRGSWGKERDMRGTSADFIMMIILLMMIMKIIIMRMMIVMMMGACHRRLEYMMMMMTMMTMMMIIMMMGILRMMMMGRIVAKLSRPPICRLAGARVENGHITLQITFYSNHHLHRHHRHCHQYNLQFHPSASSA